MYLHLLAQWLRLARTKLLLNYLVSSELKRGSAFFHHCTSLFGREFPPTSKVLPSLAETLLWTLMYTMGTGSSI